MERRNVGTIRGESPKQDLTSAKDLPIELQRDASHPTIDQNQFLSISHNTAGRTTLLNWLITQAEGTSKIIKRGHEKGNRKLDELPISFVSSARTIKWKKEQEKDFSGEAGNL